MIDEATIKQAVELLRQAAPDATIIVFGSCARGDITDDSDLDLLVVEPKVASRHEEMVRLRKVLRPLGVPADVLVASKDTFEYWSDTPNTIYYEVAREGRVFHAALP
ncbi:DNA polymerase beta domain protein region [Acidobacteriia bacterium SbA2]|nr:DNA polymerase beta domain protein region [Acidobacteriia bacterium SbA2]